MDNNKTQLNPQISPKPSPKTRPDTDAKTSPKRSNSISFRIIPAELTHMSAISEGWKEIDQESASPFGGLNESANERRIQLITTLINSHQANCWVAIDTQQNLIGVIACHAYQRPAVKQPDLGVIHGLWVAPKARRQGVGGELLAQVKHFAKEHSLDHIQVAWHPNNPAANAFWQSKQLQTYETSAIIRL